MIGPGWRGSWRWKRIVVSGLGIERRQLDSGGWMRIK